MIDSLVQISLRQRWLVLLAALAVAAFGWRSYQRLPIDAVPDITNVQVQINSTAPGFAPLEVEQRITFPVETGMAGLPRLEQTRSLSRYGLSQVTVVFREGTDIYFARQLVGERIQQVKDQLPEGVEIAMGPISSGLGEICLYTVEARKDARRADGQPYTPTDLRTLQDWVIKPQLRNVPGVNEVNTIGGFEKQIHVTPQPAQLLGYGLTFRDIVAALARNNQNVGAGYIERQGEQYLIRAPGQVKNLDEIRDLVVGSHAGVPLRIRDVAEVGLGQELRSGAATLNGEEIVLGTTLMLLGENSRTVSERVAAKLAEINRTLPDGVVARTVYNRSTLIDATIATVKRNLAEGALLVVVVLFLLLGNFRAALITALVIPLSMLFTLSGMVATGVSGNLMSLGALDFGLIVDGAVIIVENCLGRLAAAQQARGRLLARAERFAVVQSATREVVVPSLFGSFIIMVVYLPILTLTGVEGKMFTPMAQTVIMALIGAMIFSVTFVPAAVAIFLQGRVAESENFVMRGLRILYTPLLRMALARRGLVVLGAAVLIGLALLLAPRLGTEFIPSLDEGDLSIQALRIPGTSLTQSLALQQVLEKQIGKIPEVREFFARLGTAEIASDPMPPSISDGYVMLKPRSAWPDPGKSKAALIAEIEEAAAEIPGSNYEISQPIELRFNELISGVRSDLGVKIFGDDLEVLRATGRQIERLLARVPGAADVQTEQGSGLPVLTVQLDRAALGRYGLAAADVQELIAIALGGQEAGAIYEGDRRFPVVVRLPENLRTDLEALGCLPVPLPAPHSDDAPHERDPGRSEEASPFIPLSAVARFDLTPGPNQISRENGKRRLVVSANVRGRDLGSFVREVQEQIETRVTVPPGYWVEYGGQFEQLISAARRLSVVVPVALALIFVLLCLSLGNARDALLVSSGIPLALSGGILALGLRGLPLSISAGVGFIALSGVAVLNGLVMISFINRLRADGETLDRAICEGSVRRLRPVLMTALVAALGFVPMALAHGRGAEVQRPLATVVIGGILSATALTLFVLPVLYRLVHGRDAPARAQTTATKEPAPA